MNKNPLTILRSVKISSPVFIKALMLICLLPLLYINVRTTHDWGDDFAQYILQAKNIFHPPVITQQVTGLENYTPQFRPGGFPLLLAPFLFFFGNNFYVLMLLNSVFLIATCLLAFQLFKSYFAVSVSFIMTMVFAYNPYLLRLKAEVMPEFLFTLLLVSGILIYKNKIRNYKIYTVLIAAALLLVKYSGIAFVLAIAAENLVSFYKTKEMKTGLKGISTAVLFFFIPFGIYFLINNIIFQLPLNVEGWYGRYFFSGNYFATVAENIVHYKQVFLYSYEQEVPQFVNLVIKTSALIFFLAGIILRWIRKPELQDFVFIFYIAILLAYPYTNGGYRFLFPVIPFALIYIVTGINFYVQLLPAKKIFLTELYLLVILFSYRINIKTIIRETPRVQSGPHESAFSECIDFIKQNTSASDCFMFPKPWAFALFSERKVIPLTGNNNSVAFNNAINKHHVNYILACTDQTSELFDSNFLNLVYNERSCKKIWNNNDYIIFSKGNERVSQSEHY